MEEYLQRLAPQQRESLAEMLGQYPRSAVVYPARLGGGDLLARAGEPCDRVHILVSGRAAVFAPLPHALEHAVTTFSAVTFFGECELLGGRPQYLADVRAVGSCQAVSIPAADYLQWVHRDQEILAARARSALGMLMEQMSSERSMHGLDAVSRVTQALIRAYPHIPPQADGSVRVPLTRAAIAAQTGLSVRTVNRAIRAMKEHGQLAIEKGKALLTENQYQAMCRVLEIS